MPGHSVDADIVLGLLPLSEAPSTPELAWLDGAERARLAAMAGPIRPREFLGGRFLLRSMAARLLDVAPSDIRVELEPSGRPRVRAPRELFVGLSHTREYAACALSCRPIGLDIEELGRKGELRGVEELAFSPIERASLAGLSGPARERAFFAIWTLKEAYLKRVGLGIPDVDRAPSFDVGPGTALAASGGETCGYLCFAFGDSIIGALSFDPPCADRDETGNTGGPVLLFDPRYAPGPGLSLSKLFGSAELPRLPDQ